ncbi:hypothetical protein GALMADRAFT_561716 [Galerina marginata CBS 339.88]|uniref:Uncharacterized protein n=1 Tax=Galerina marginata (strain CBS 339.88) TaxID=685588 RepID=A0A067SXF0_GALM3|nr:hypothetical protein GALMADRAFT_561716 [Galerina marginata CBS 339.88]
MPKNPHLRHNFQSYIQGAAPTLELQEAVEQSSVASYLADWRSHYLIPDFFAAIGLWNIDGAPNLYDEQLRRFDRFAMGVLEVMYADHCLSALISIVKSEIIRDLDNGILRELFSLSKTQQSADKLSFSYWAQFSSDYRHLILEFLEDPHRSGIYTFTGERYATAAVYFIKYVYSHPEPILPSFSMRHLVQKADSSEAAQILQWQLLKNQRTLSLGWGSSNMFNSDCAYGHALRCLAHVLPQSAISEELITLASQHIFGPLSRKFPDRKREVKQEIARYLARAAHEKS